MESLVALILWQNRNACGAPTTLAGRFAMSFDLLRRLIANFGGASGPTGPFTAEIYHRIGRMGRRLANLIHRYETGTLPKPRPHRPIVRERAARPAPDPASHLPTRFGWMLGWVQKCIWPVGQFERMVLSDPEAQAFLAAAPQAGRILRPLFHMAGVACPASLALPRRQKNPKPTLKHAQRKPRRAKRRARMPPPPPRQPTGYRATAALRPLFGRLRKTA